ncbi:MAG: transcriptional regulator NrdR [Myxococcota bacterium]|nr:transcriptional regulator NrdR [Myxococcota bacterium]
MRCPFCGDENNRVIDSRLGRDETEIRRRRECQECQRRFTTRERVEDVLPRIVKRDERREDFDRRKLLASLEKACAKRPVSVDALERLADRIEKRAQESGDPEVLSDRLGEWVLDELVRIDTLAAARFASVFRDFQNADDYAAFFEDAAARRAAAREELPSVRAPEPPRRPPA